jgi:hypothetical protein
VVAEDGTTDVPGRAAVADHRRHWGSNGPRVRLWKWEIQRLADRTGMSIIVCHFPPGTSKWNKIVHRLFSYFSTNWRGQPLINLAVIVSLMASTRTVAGLRER